MIVGVIALVCCYIDGVDCHDVDIYVVVDDHAGNM